MQCFSRLGCVHVVNGRRMGAPEYDSARYTGPGAAPHVYDVVAAALAGGATPQTIVCMGAGAADVADALCTHVARNQPAEWGALRDVMEVVCPSGPERVVFSLDEAQCVCAVRWDVPLPPYDAAPLLAMWQRAGTDDDPVHVAFAAQLRVLGVDAALLWRAAAALDALRRGRRDAAASMLGLEARAVGSCQAPLAALLHRRIIDWLVSHTHTPRRRPKHTLAVCVEPAPSRAAGYDQLCRAVVSDMLHAALDAAFVAADRDERRADGLAVGTAAPGRFSCDYAAGPLRTALATAEGPTALVAALAPPLVLEHARGRATYVDVAAWYATDRHVEAGAAQQLLSASKLGAVAIPAARVDRRGSTILLSPGRAPPSVFGARVEATSALLAGGVRLHWVCCDDADTVRRLQRLQCTAGLLHVRVPHADFVARYACTVAHVPRVPAAILAATVGADGGTVGTRCVWLSTPAAECLARLAASQRTRAATLVQAWWRGLRVRRRSSSASRIEPRAAMPELAVLRVAAASAYAAEHAWERRHAPADAPAYAGLRGALCSALGSLALVARPWATAAVVVRLMRYAGWTRPAYDALTAAVADAVRAGRATPAAARALAAVGAADATADRALVLRLWLALAQPPVRRALAGESAALLAAASDPHNEASCVAGVAAWARVVGAVGPELVAVASGVVDAQLAGAQRACSAADAMAAGMWAARCEGLSVPRWRSMLAVAMLHDRRVLQDAAARAAVCPLLTRRELGMLGVVVDAAEPAAQASPALPAVDVARVLALDVAFY
jgi:hypothetical protein